MLKLYPSPAGLTLTNPNPPLGVSPLSVRVHDRARGRSRHRESIISGMDVAVEEGRQRMGVGRDGRNVKEGETRQPRATPPHPPSSPSLPPPTPTTGHGQKHIAFPKQFLRRAQPFLHLFPMPRTAVPLWSSPTSLRPPPSPPASCPSLASPLIMHPPVSSSLPRPSLPPSLLSSPLVRRSGWGSGWGIKPRQDDLERPSFGGKEGGEYGRVEGKGGGARMNSW
jgi:hypothetical protein